MSTLAQLLSIYGWPSQALWRDLEVAALRAQLYERPILEIGCGSGELTALILPEVDEAIDINPRAVEKCRTRCGATYREVRCLDARQLGVEQPRFRTVFANCVFEHIPGLEEVLKGCFAALLPGGRLVATVPLEAMNQYLTFPWRAYARLRQRQLRHHNLWTADKWSRMLEAAGFHNTRYHTYLDGEACRYWDRWDMVACLGWGHVQLAAIVGRLFWDPLPAEIRKGLVARWAKKLENVRNRWAGTGEACAVLLTAEKPRE